MYSPILLKSLLYLPVYSICFEDENYALLNAEECCVYTNSAYCRTSS